MSALTVGRIMTKNVVSLNPEHNLASAQALLGLAHTRHLPVLDGGRLVGIISHRDILRAQSKGGNQLAGKYMTRDATTIEPETPAYEAARILLANKFGCLPVVDAAGDLVGIVTEADFVLFAAEILEKSKYEE